MKTYSLEEQKANRKLWVEALRSGEYEQGRANLHLEGKHCCLGVLCRLAGYSDEDIDRIGTLVNFPLALEFVGLRGALGGYGGDYLADDNDAGKPFSELAYIIESEPAGLFIESRP